MFKKSFTALILLSLSISSYGATFGRSAGSSRTSAGITRSVSSPSFSRSSYSSSSNYYRPTYTRTYTDNTYQHAAPQQVNKGHSTSALIGAAAAGALAGHLMTGNNNGIGYGGIQQPVMQQPIVQQGGYIQPEVMQQGVGMVQPYYNSSFPWGWLFLFALLGVICFFLTKLKNKDSSKMNELTDGLTDSAIRLFIDFQKNNKPSGIEFIKAKSTPEFFEMIKENVLAEKERDILVQQVNFEVSDVDKRGSKYIASLKYNATVKEGDNTTELSEMWNFVLDGEKWLLEGVESI